jgi:hypothetical protein
MELILPPEMRHSRPAPFRGVQRARWVTSEQGQRIPAEVGGTLSPAAAAIYELFEVIQKNAPPMLRHSSMCR